jgi:HD superfamily phosphohydrolase
MLERAGERLLDSTDLDATQFARMTDDRLLGALRDCPATADAARRLEHRDLHKRAIWAKLDAVPESVVSADHEDVRAFERDIAEVADVAPEDVLVDTPGEPSMPETSTRVVVDGEVRRLADESPLVEGLRAAGRAQWRLGVYAPEADVPEVRAAAERVLGVEIAE